MSMEKGIGHMLQLYGFEKFEPTAPMRYAIQALKAAIPAGCLSMTFVFDEQAAVLISALTVGGQVVDVEPSDEIMAAAGMLLDVVSYQARTLFGFCEGFGDDIWHGITGLLRQSLLTHGLSAGCLPENVSDKVDDLPPSLTVSRI